MKEKQSISEVVENIYESIRATPSRKRRLLSKTFWDKFGFKNRTQERVAEISQAFRERSVLISIPDKVLGDEAKGDWIVLTYMAPEPPEVAPTDTSSPSVISMPSDDWFEKMANHEFESEREVEYYFIIPFLEQLGYVEDDIAIGFPVDLRVGSQKRKKDGRVAHPDVVVFDGKARDEKKALLTIEAKSAKFDFDNKNAVADATGQTRSYALWLTTPYFVIANGINLQIYRNGLGVAANQMILECHRTELRQKWLDIYVKLNRSAAVKHKDELENLIKQKD